MGSHIFSTILAGASSVLLFAACGSGKVGKEDTAVLDTSAVFSKTEVLHFLHEHPAISKSSVTYFTQGVDEYRNKKNTNAAYELFVQSVAAHPSARAYYELGNVCLEKGAYDHAIEAYEIAEQLGYEPVSKLLYNIACVYSKQEMEPESSAYLSYAIEAGYSDLKHIMNDPDLKFVRESYVFQSTYQEAMSGSSDPEVTLWQSYKQQFKTAAMPILLNLKTDFGEQKLIHYDYEKFVSEMRTEKFSREVGKEFYYYATVESNPTYTAVIYAIKNSIISEDAPLTYMMVSYDGKGTLIDKKQVGGQMELDQPYLAGAIQPNLHFEIKQFKNVYEKDPRENGYANNPVVKSDLLSMAYYKIDEAGKFVQLPDGLTMN